MSNAPLIAVVGPTAAGKSALAMQLAVLLNAEIVNADAFCLYREMDIGTAKPTPEDRLRIPHHVIDTHDVADEVDVATYQHLARAAIEEITGRGVPAVLAGGSGLYVQAVLDDLEFPGTDPQIRARLTETLEQIGPQALHARLREVDPQAASAILPSNGRRVVRALEVNEITGRPFIATLAPRGPWRPALRIGWDPGVDIVDAAIETRVRSMWDAGFVAEAIRLAPRMSRTASRAVGYREILADPTTALEATVTATRRLARRQRKWFRRDADIHWAQTPAQVDEILGRLGV